MKASKWLVAFCLVAVDASRLRSPPSHASNATAVSSAVDCSMFAGLVHAQVSPKCCFAVNVVAQRTLQQFGMAKKCLPSWECEKDGMATTLNFEKKALKEMCGEPHCVDATVEAMKSNWMTKQGSMQFGSICDTQSMDGKPLEFHRTNLHTTGDKWATDGCKECKKKYVDKGCEGRKGCENRKVELEAKTDADFCPTTEAGSKQEGKNAGHECYAACCETGPACFPGHAKVTTRQGPIDLASVEIGDELLVEETPGRLNFAPVLTFIHRLPASMERSYVEVAHEFGTFRASEMHLVFTCTDSDVDRVDKYTGDLQPGERLCAVDGAVTMPSRILDVRRLRSTSGMMAPLTSTGTIVVDGVVASNYAAPARKVPVSHWLGHFTLLPLRAYYTSILSAKLEHLWHAVCRFPAFGEVCAATGQLEMHPFVSLLKDNLRLEYLVSAR
eukprot:gnl/TRDRNA2_/TRDRNA2_189101_c0_seq1.p1 gnl/TRDRNA2_/TRDRNA2_189101_c0~~gnl/TRDRNA2_/TRDRNA2_189101_c0_seq1.p1  ORF type:complete len:443 (+),score=80.62 gnl/TRDRNA2_/TRDRNA2_189101_c0_seq1:121-1449(+)